MYGYGFRFRLQCRYSAHIQSTNVHICQGRIQDFKLGGGGAHIKKLRRAEGGAKNVGVFRVKNHDFTPKNRIFSNFRGGGGGRARRVRPPGSAPLCIDTIHCKIQKYFYTKKQQCMYIKMSFFRKKNRYRCFLYNRYTCYCIITHAIHVHV